MKAGLAIVQRLGFFSPKAASSDHQDDRFDMRLQRLARPVLVATSPKALVFKKTH